MEDWEPKIEEVNKVIALLEQSRSGDNFVQRKLTEQLLVLSSNPEFTYYLMLIFSRLKETSMLTRVSAGLMAKNNISKHFLNFSGQLKGFILECAISSLSDPLRQIRGSASAIISKVVFMDNFVCWESVLTRLLLLIDSGCSGQPGDLNGVLGAFSTLRCISEDTDGSFSVSGSIWL